MRSYRKRALAVAQVPEYWCGSGAYKRAALSLSLSLSFSLDLGCNMVLELGVHAW